MNINLDPTGERYIPALMSGQIEVEHMQRYKSVLRLVEGKKVLDAACGAGYGSALMSSVAKEVTGIDISSEAISYDNERYGHISNLKYIEASIAELPFEDNSFDVIISFETIEHVNEDLQIKFLKEIKRCLNADGVLVMSSPDKRTYSDLLNFDNEYHVKEFYFDEFKKFLNGAFNNVEFYYQGMHKTKMEFIRKCKSIDNENYLKINDWELELDNELYNIAVCSDREINGEIYNLNSVYSFPRYQSFGFPLINGEYVSENVIYPIQKFDGDKYIATFQLDKYKSEGRFRFDPEDGEPCILELCSIITDIRDYKIEPYNAYKSDGSVYTFCNDDPIIEIVGDYSEATYIKIEYKIKELSYSILSKYIEEINNNINEIKKENTQIKEENTQIKEENIRLKNDIIAIKSTRGYRLLEKMRSFVRKK